MCDEFKLQGIQKLLSVTVVKITKPKHSSCFSAFRERFWPGAGGGASHKKQTGMLVVSLRGVNLGFWSRLGYPGQSANILWPPRSRLGFPEETQNYAKRNRSQILF